MRLYLLKFINLQVCISSGLCVFRFVCLQICVSSVLCVFRFVCILVCVYSGLCVFWFVCLGYCISSNLYDFKFVFLQVCMSSGLYVFRFVCHQVSMSSGLYFFRLVCLKLCLSSFLFAFWFVCLLVCLSSGLLVFWFGFECLYFYCFMCLLDVYLMWLTSYSYNAIHITGCLVWFGFIADKLRYCAALPSDPCEDYSWQGADLPIGSCSINNLSNPGFQREEKSKDRQTLNLKCVLCTVWKPRKKP